MPNAKKVAYQIQEALASAKELSIPRYDKLRGKWRIKYKGENITAEKLDIAMPSSLRFDNVTDPLDIVQTVINHKSVKFDLLFPDARVDELVTEWCEQNEFVCIFDEHGLLISRPDKHGNTPAE